MFRKTSTESADTSAPSGPTCKWSHLTKRGQGLTIEIKQLVYKYGPRMAKELPVHRDVEFHGVVTTPGFYGVRANGELWVVQPDEMPGTLRDRWKQVPKVVDGRAHLASFDADEIANSSFEITLFCNPTNFGEFIQLVNGGLASGEAPTFKSRLTSCRRIMRTRKTTGTSHGVRTRGPSSIGMSCSE
jgi:hypothetical protein